MGSALPGPDREQVSRVHARGSDGWRALLQDPAPQITRRGGHGCIQPWPRQCLAAPPRQRWRQVLEPRIYALEQAPCRWRQARMPNSRSLELVLQTRRQVLEPRFYSQDSRRRVGDGRCCSHVFIHMKRRRVGDGRLQRRILDDRSWCCIRDGRCCSYVFIQGSRRRVGGCRLHINGHRRRCCIGGDGCWSHEKIRLSLEPKWPRKVKMKIRGTKRKMRETVKSAKWRVEERSKRTITETHETWMIRCAHTPWANVTCDTAKHACKHEKMWRVRVFCAHSPSVAADCHQL